MWWNCTCVSFMSCVHYACRRAAILRVAVLVVTASSHDQSSVVKCCHGLFVQAVTTGMWSKSIPASFNGVSISCVTDPAAEQSQCKALSVSAF